MYRVVVFKVHVGLGVLDVFEHLHHLGGNDDAHAAVEPFGVDADEAEVDDIGLLQGFEQSNQGSWSQSAARRTHRVGNGREGQSEADHLVVLIEDGSHISDVDDKLEIVDHHLFHALGERYGAVKQFVGFVEQLEDAVSVFLEEIIGVACRSEMQVVAFHHEFGQLVDLAIVILRDAQSAARPVHLFLIAKILDKGLIIRIVISLLEGGRIVETVNEQSFAFEVGIAQGSHDLVHAFLDGPSLNGFEEFARDFLIFNDIEMGKTHLFLAGLFVGGSLHNA